MGLKEKIERLRTWLSSRKLVYCEPFQDIDFSKDVDDGLKLLDDVVAVLDEAKQDIIQHLINRPKYINQDWFKWESELESKLVNYLGVLNEDDAKCK